jgi:hypothetical protein
MLMEPRDIIARWLASRPANAKPWDQLAPGTQTSYRFDADRLINSLSAAGYEIVPRGNKAGGMTPNEARS